MPLARLGWTTVLLLSVMPESAAGYDQMARPSSPVLRMKLFCTVQLVAFPLKFRPSASVDRTSVFSTVQLLLPYWSQNPTLVSWIHRPFTVQPEPSEPSMALAVLSSWRPTVEPRIANPLRLTGPATTEVLSMSSLVLICEYQSPAPTMVALLTCSAEPTRKVPGGIHTDWPAELAAEMALRKAAVESEPPVGSAPSETTEMEPAGWAAAAATS